MDTRDTLIRLLASFQQDVQACMHHESQDFILSQPGADGGQSTVADPILLGNFVVDSFNRHLAQAQEATQSDHVRAMPEVSPLAADGRGEAPEYDGNRPRTHGSDPRLGKMAEVMLAVGQLLAVLESEACGVSDAHRDTLETLLTALDSLGEQVAEVHGGAPGHTPDMIHEATGALAERYNTILDIVYETCDDPIVPRLFTRIDVGGGAQGDGPSARALVELAANRASLAAYLRKLAGRSETGSGMRGHMSHGHGAPALPG